MKRNHTFPKLEDSNKQNGNGCRHYWKIESANGPTSKGVCKFCRAEQDFHNSPRR